jgi:hypothetical protein
MGDTTDVDAGIAGAGGIIKAGSAFAAGNAKSSLEMLNAGIASTQAKSEMETGAYNSNLARLRGEQVEGQQVSGIGANNLRQAGTPATVVANTAAASERNVLNVQNNALRRAWGFQVQGTSDTYQAELAKQGGMLSGIGDLTSTAGTVYKDLNTAGG